MLTKTEKTNGMRRYRDLHFDKLDHIVPRANHKIVQMLQYAFDWALDRGIYNVIQYGDVCERPRMSYQSQVLLYDLILHKKYRRLNFHFLLGNHDFAEDGSHSLQVLDLVALKLDRNVEVYTSQTDVDIDDCPFRFLPYPATDTSSRHINVGHFETKGSLRDNGRKIEEGVETKHTVLMGHLHTKHRVNNVYHSGTMYQTNFGESMPKFFHHVTATGPKDIDVQCIQVDPPWRLNNLTIESASDLRQLKKNDVDFYKLFIKDGVDFDLNRILVDYPNVVKHNSFKTRQDLEVLKNKDFVLDFEEEEAVVNENEFVKTSLRTKGFDKQKVRRGLQILEKVRS